MNLRASHPYLLILPSFLLAAFIILWPLSEISSCHARREPLRPACATSPGLANFCGALRRSRLHRRHWRTLIWTVGVVVGTLIVSVPIALILNDDFYGRGLARVIVMLPWAVSLTMTAIVWRWALNGESGMLNSGLMRPRPHRPRTSNGWRRPRPPSRCRS